MSDAERIDVALGYDPGGDGSHGVAALHLEEGGRVRAAEVDTVETAEDAIAWLAARLPATDGAQAAIGIDTLTTWSTGSAGWRPADEWLRTNYPEVKNSVASPNSLRGAMAINGILAMARLRERMPRLIVSETHPKVLHYAFTNSKYAFEKDAGLEMTATLRDWLGVESLVLKNDHEWDALVSAHAVHQGVVGAWRDDLHARPVGVGEVLVRPAGPSFFYWPPSA